MKIPIYLQSKKIIPIGLRFLGALFLFILILIINRNFGLSTYGELVYYQIIAGFFATIVLAGLDKSIIANFHRKKKDNRNEMIAKNVMLILVNLFVLTILILVSKNYLAEVNINTIIIPIVILKSFRLYFNELGRVGKHYVFYAFQAFVFESVILIGVFYFDLVIFKPSALVLSEFVILIISSIMLFKNIESDFLKVLVRSFKWKFYKSELESSRTFFLLGISVYLVSWSDQFILKNLVDFAILGLYASLIRVGQISTMPLSALRMIWHNEISQSFHDGNKDSKKDV